MYTILIRSTTKTTTKTTQFILSNTFEHNKRQTDLETDRQNINFNSYRVHRQYTLHISPNVHSIPMQEKNLRQESKSPNMRCNRS